MARSRPTLLLVHGGHHGAWCWDLLTPELEAMGWIISTVDLPVSDPSLGAEAYANAIVEQVTPEPMVAIGHSMAGVVIPLLVDRMPIEGLVFLNAMTPVPGKSVSQQYADEPDSRGRAADGLGNYIDGVRQPIRQGALDLYYHDCDPERADWALDRLVPQSARVITETTPLKKWPQVPVASIVALDDRAIPYAWAIRSTRERLGIEAVSIPGGHSPFLARPAELAKVLSETIASMLDAGW